MEPAYKSLDTTICAACKKQHVFAEGSPVCGHFLTETGKRICRRCWGKIEVRKKHSKAQHITV